MRRTTAGALLLGLVFAAAGAPAGPRPPAAGASLPVEQVYGRLPLSFEPTGAGFSARGPGYGVDLESDGARLLLGDVALGMRIYGARGDVAGEGGDLLPGRVNRLTGADPAGWRVDVPTFARVSYAGVYEGIDVVWYGRGGQLEFDLVVAAGADPDPVTMGFDGADQIGLDAGGDLVVKVGGDILLQRRPVAYQDGGGGRRPVDARYVARGGDRFGVAVGDYDRSRPLVIDPVLVYSTFLGGTGVDEAYDVKVDGAGNAYVAGYTASQDFPTANALQPSPQGTDAVVFKVNPAGTALLYSTYLGGAGADYAFALAVDGSGAAHMAGRSNSAQFPLQAPAQATYGGGASDAFVVKLAPSGAAILYGTYLGGTGGDQASGIALDGSGNAFVTGTTSSTNFPTVGALQPANAGEGDAFVARLSAAGALSYATYFGGSGEDTATDVDVDPSGNAVVVGSTRSTNFPTVAAVQGSLRGYRDAFVTRLNAGGSTIGYSTYLGGTAYQDDHGRLSREAANGVAVDAAGNAYLTGFTESGDFPTHNALFPYSSYYDAFITKVAPSGALVYSTYLGAPEASETGEDIAIDVAGNAHITGITAGPVPEKDPLQARRDWHDAFVTKLSADGSQLLFSTNFGGDSDDWGRGITVDGSGAIYVVGQTQHTLGLGGQPVGEPFPTKNAIQPTPRGSLEMFLSKISPAPAPAIVIAGSTWYSDGGKSKSGPAGTGVAAYAVGGREGVPYRLVLARVGNCVDTVAVLNRTVVRPGPSGVIGRVRGTVPLGTPPGTYEVCFRHDGATTATGVVTFVVP